MPLQHGSTKMLKAMRRGITQERTEDLIAEIGSLFRVLRYAI